MQNTFWKNLKKPIIGLSPMDGVTDAAFRLINAKYGKPSILITEFTSVEALKHGAVKALEAFDYNQIERPIIAQIYGTDLEAFYQATLIVCELGFDGLDINMGCPSKSVSSNGAGAGLIRTPEHAQKIIKICKQAVIDFTNGKKLEEANLFPTVLKKVKEMVKDGDRKSIPVSVKTRIGFDEIITEKWIQTLIETQPDNISLHGRILKQMYTGEANWEEIGKAAKLVKNSGINFLGNGDIQNLNDALEKIEKYQLDGVLIGRASYGNPWVFQKEAGEISPLQKLNLAIEHSQLYESLYGLGPKNFAPMKKHLGWYCHNFAGAKELRIKLLACNSSAEVETTISQNFPAHP